MRHLSALDVVVSKLLTVIPAGIDLASFIQKSGPRAVPGVERIDPLHFVAGCRKRRLNQALVVLSLS